MHALPFEDPSSLSSPSINQHRIYVSCICAENLCLNLNWKNGSNFLWINSFINLPEANNCWRLFSYLKENCVYPSHNWIYFYFFFLSFFKQFPKSKYSSWSYMLWLKEEEDHRKLWLYVFIRKINNR